MFRKRRSNETIRCPACDRSLPATATACRFCGEDWDPDDQDHLAEGGFADQEDDDFDYDEFVSREFGGSQTSKTLRPAYRAVAVVMVIVFALSLLYPLLFL